MRRSADVRAAAARGLCAWGAPLTCVPQVVSELLAVALVGAVVAAAPAALWVRERATFNGSMVAVAPALRREEFLEAAARLLAERGMPACTAAGRDLRLGPAAARAFALAARCECRACYQCAHCDANDCICLRGAPPRSRTRSCAHCCAICLRPHASSAPALVCARARLRPPRARRAL